jgi:flagellar export protein FliJ
MRTQAFRLAVVERLRANRLAEAGKELARLQKAFLQARAHRMVLDSHLMDCVPVTDPNDDQGRAVTEYLATSRRREQLRGELAEADILLEDLSGQVEHARQEWLSARARLRAVESLHDRHRSAVRRAQDRAEQKEIDDLAASRGKPLLRTSPTVSLRDGQHGGGGEAA